MQHRDQHQPPDDADLVRRAAEFQDDTARALALARRAEDGDDPAAHREAAAAALAAGRPAHALRLTARANQLDPDNEAGKAGALAAERALVAAARSSTRAGEAATRVFIELVNACIAAGGGKALDLLLLTEIESPELDPMLANWRDGESVTAIDFINAALARLGSGGIRLIERPGDGGEVVEARRVEIRAGRQPSIHEMLELTSAGAACQRCGAPRWTFTHDDDHGEYCAVCAFPLDLGVLSQHRRRATAEGLQRELEEHKGRADAAERKVEQHQRQVASLSGKIENLGAAVQKEREHRHRLIGAGRVPVDALVSDPASTVEDLRAAASGAAARAAASAAQADALALEIARRAGGREGSG